MIDSYFCLLGEFVVLDLKLKERTLEGCLLQLDGYIRSLSKSGSLEKCVVVQLFSDSKYGVSVKLQGFW